MCVFLYCCCHLQASSLRCLAFPAATIRKPGGAIFWVSSWRWDDSFLVYLNASDNRNPRSVRFMIKNNSSGDDFEVMLGSTLNGSHVVVHHNIQLLHLWWYLVMNHRHKRSLLVVISPRYQSARQPSLNIPTTQPLLINDNSLLFCHDPFLSLLAILPRTANGNLKLLTMVTWIQTGLGLSSPRVSIPRYPSSDHFGVQLTFLWGATNQ